MIVPSIDLMDGTAVQLVEGKTKVLDAGDPRPIADQFDPRNHPALPHVADVLHAPDPGWGPGSRVERADHP